MTIPIRIHQLSNYFEFYELVCHFKLIVLHLYYCIIQKHLCEFISFRRSFKVTDFGTNRKPISSF